MFGEGPCPLDSRTAYALSGATACRTEVVHGAGISVVAVGVHWRLIGRAHRALPVAQSVRVAWIDRLHQTANVPDLHYLIGRARRRGSGTCLCDVTVPRYRPADRPLRRKTVRGAFA